jgi:hypothetical protein
MAYDNIAVRKGQAFNLAVHDAVHAGQAENPKYIYQKFIYYYSIGDALQGSSIDMIQEVIDNSDFDSLIKNLKNTLGA